MKLLRLPSAIVVLVSVLGISGCPRKPVLVAPQQPPPITAATPQPTPTPEPTVTPQPTEEEQKPAVTEEQPAATTAKNKPKNTKRTPAKKPATSSAANEKQSNEATKTPKIVIQADKGNVPQATSSGGGQISPGPTPTDGTQNQASTEQLLQSAEGNLNNLKRQLSKDEEAMRAQIKEFISQSRKAISENDPTRAHNLAVKARLLSDDLVKQR
jgi:type IV secretory pathway VirB10-like protein